MYPVTIIIPVYNVEKYIIQCLSSVSSQQNIGSIECILVDDCGTDESINIAEKYINEYNGNIVYRIIHHSKNQGLSAARNSGIREAKGKYVYFLDSDDMITPQCMENFIKVINEHDNVDLIQGMFSQNSSYMKHFLSQSFPSYTEDRKYIKNALLDYDKLPVCAANKMIRKQLIIDNNLFFKEGIIHEDNYWSFFLAKHVKSLAVYPEKCYLYTENPDSITKAVNIKKETLSFYTMINDFSNNIDPFLKGEQKLCILRLLNNAINHNYYESEGKKKELFNMLYKRCYMHEKAILKLWFSLKRNTSLCDKMFNLCASSFRMLN